MINIYTKIFTYFAEIQYIHSIVLIRNIIMNILNFMQRFPDEASCIAYLKEQREQSGIVCKHCGCTEHRWDANKLVFECKHCHHRQSLRSGTVMEHSKLPFRYWIAAMFLLTSTKKSFFNRGNPSPVRSQTLSTHLGDGLQASGCHGKA